MAWVAGYHNWIGERYGKTRPTWREARAEMVDELDQRVMGYETNPSDGGNEDEIEELRYARDYFAGLEDGEEGCTDADGLTFVLIPELPGELAYLDDEQVCEVDPAPVRPRPAGGHARRHRDHGTPRDHSPGPACPPRLGRLGRHRPRGQRP